MKQLLSHDSVDSVISAICLMQGCFVIGVSMLVFWTFWRSPKIIHIACVAMSHVLLTVLVCQALSLRLYLLYPWRLPMAMIAFGLSDYGIMKIYNQRTRHP